MQDEEFKPCPFCKESIRVKAVKCRYCGEWFEQSANPTSGEPVKPADNKIPPPAISVENPAATLDNSPRIEPIVHAGEFPVEASGTVQDDHILGEIVFRDLAEKLQIYPDEETWKREFLFRRTSKTHVESSVIEEIWLASAAAVRKSETSSKKEPRRWPIFPLIVFLFLVLEFALPRAIETGVSDIGRLFLNTLVYCTTPSMILFLVLTGYWFFKGYQAYRLSSQRGERLKFDLSYTASVIFVSLILAALAFSNSKTAWQKRAAKEKQYYQEKGINPDAFKDWEILKKNSNQKIVDSENSLTPETKKRMRESFALQCKGELASVNGVTVSLEGQNHDRLIFSVNASMRTNIAEIFTDALKQEDPDFWNRLRYFEFKTLEFSGTNNSKIFTEADFYLDSEGYEKFVTNLITMYGTKGNHDGFLDAQGNIVPEMQLKLRQNLANALNGSFKSLSKSYDVKLLGTNLDILIISNKDLDQKDMEDLLAGFQNDQKGYFYNGLTAMGFNSFNLEGRNYRREIVRKQFSGWCRNYDEYKKELLRVVNQMSASMGKEIKSP